MSYDAYAKAQRQSEDPRDTEYRAFATSTRGLLAVEDGDQQSLAEALHVNRSLWEALASDCAQEANALPRELRARIISLARWVADYSRQVLRQDAEIDALVDINRIMMDGLSGKTNQ